MFSNDIKPKTQEEIDDYNLSCKELYITGLKNGEELKEYTSYKLNKELDGINIADYLSVNDNFFYVGRFSEKTGDLLIKYNINPDGTLSKSTELIVPFPKIQGMCVVDYNGEDYYFFSS